MRALSRLWAVAAVAAGLFASSAAAAPVGLVERFDLGCQVRDMVSGPGSSVWFACFEKGVVSGGRGKVGQITPAGQVTKFAGDIDPGSEPGAIVVGPDGDLWFTINTGINLLPRERRPAAIGRVTPSGGVATFKAGLGSDTVLGDIVAEPDGTSGSPKAGEPRAGSRRQAPSPPSVRAATGQVATAGRR